MNEEFKCGDVVKITDRCWVYPNYEEFSLLKNVNNWERGKEPENNTLAKIIDFGPHESQPKYGMIYLVEQDNYTYMMSPKGFELHASLGYKSFCDKTETIPNDSSRWNCKCRCCGHDAYDSGFSYECSKGCHD